MEKAPDTKRGSKICDHTVSEAELDEALAESFPSSDPLQWTLGVDPHCEPPAKSREGEPEKGSKARPAVQTITTDELKRKLDRREEIHIWNVLTDEYFHGEMIPGSHRVPLDQVGRHVARAHLANDAEIIVYCAGPQCPMSRMAAEKLQKLAYTNVKAYEGGLEEWKEAGYEIEQLMAA